MYTLINAININKNNPDTFQLPSQRKINALGIGVFVKLIFETPDGNTERIWVKITEINNFEFTVLIYNDPEIVNLKYLDKINFKLENIIDITADTFDLNIKKYEGKNIFCRPKASDIILENSKGKLSYIQTDIPEYDFECIVTSVRDKNAHLIISSVVTNQTFDFNDLVSISKDGLIEEIITKGEFRQVNIILCNQRKPFTFIHNLIDKEGILYEIFNLNSLVIFYNLNELNKIKKLLENYQQSGYLESYYFKTEDQS